MIEAVAPALPLHTAGKYVAGAYVVFIALLLIYLSIMAIRLSRTERDLAELNRELAERDARDALAADSAPATHHHEEALQ
jgi:hypothetical protein